MILRPNLLRPVLNRPQLLPQNLISSRDVAAAAATFSTDATSGKAVPESSAEWSNFIAANSLTLATPNYLHLCQEASGNLADSIGSLTLTAQNTPLYQQSVTGWTRKGIGGDGATAGSFRNAAGPNPSLTSVAQFYYLHIPGFDATVRYIAGFGAGDNVSLQGFVTSGKSILRARLGASLAALTVDHDFDVAGQTIAVLVVSNLSATGVEKLKVYTQLDEAAPAAEPAAPGSATTYALGSNTGTFAACQILYSCGWSGAGAEITSAQALAFFQALGYSPSWS